MVIIDSEFEKIIPPQSEDERAGLEASLLAEGCRDALVVWQGKNILIDGHHRYAICTQHNIPFKTVEREFASREDVIVWIAQNQLARRNIVQFVKDRLALKIKAALTEIGKRNMAQGLSDTDKPQNTQKSIAELANTSTGGIAQTEVIEAKAPPAIKEQVEKGEMSRNRAYELTKALGVLPVEYQDKAAALVVDNLEKAQILARLHKSLGNPDTNGTFDEIMDTGGFSYGDEMEKWCNFKEHGVEVIRKGLDSIIQYHRAEAGKNKPAPHVAHNSGENEWYTPLAYIQAARRVMGSIDLDPASSDIANQTVEAERIYSISDDGLAHEWAGRVWMNPPYASELIKLFAAKFAKHVRTGDITEGIVLVNNSTETQWFVELVSCASSIVFPKGRVKFLDVKGNEGAPLQGQAIIYFGDNPALFLREFKSFGWGATL